MMQKNSISFDSLMQIIKQTDLFEVSVLRNNFVIEEIKEYRNY